MRVGLEHAGLSLRGAIQIKNTGKTRGDSQEQGKESAKLIVSPLIPALFLCWHL